jgi:hypothetical protein
LVRPRAVSRAHGVDGSEERGLGAATWKPLDREQVSAGAFFFHRSGDADGAVPVVAAAKNDPIPAFGDEVYLAAWCRLDTNHV